MDYNKLLEEYNKLKEENLHLKELLKKNNITYNFVEKSKLSLIEKISIFKSYFKGNSSVFAEKYYKKMVVKAILLYVKIKIPLYVK